jgi:hypothetical protein
MATRELVERSGSPWFVLSAKYGLVSPDEILAPYDRTLNRMGKDERRAWASRVKAQMEQRLPATKRIIVFAGQKYREFLMDYLRGRGALVHVPLQDFRIGEQLAWLAEHRGGKPDEGSDPHL